MKKTEYKRERASSEDEAFDRANSLAAENWELVSVVRITGNTYFNELIGYTCWFKRERPDDTGGPNV